MSDESWCRQSEVDPATQSLPAAVTADSFTSMLDTGRRPQTDVQQPSSTSYVGHTHQNLIMRALRQAVASQKLVSENFHQADAVAELLTMRLTDSTLTLTRRFSKPDLDTAVIWRKRELGLARITCQYDPLLFILPSYLDNARQSSISLPLVARVNAFSI